MEEELKAPTPTPQRKVVSLAAFRRQLADEHERPPPPFRPAAAAHRPARSVRIQAVARRYEDHERSRRRRPVGPKGPMRLLALPGHCQVALDILEGQRSQATAPWPNRVAGCQRCPRPDWGLSCRDCSSRDGPSGRNLRVDYRWGAGNVATMRKYAAELAALMPDVLLGPGNTPVGPLLEATHAATDPSMVGMSTSAGTTPTDWRSISWRGDLPSLMRRSVSEPAEL